MTVSSVPDVQLRAQRLEKIVVGLGPWHFPANGSADTRIVDPQPAVRYLTHNRNCRNLGDVGDLRGKHTASGQRLDQTRENRLVIWHPLENTIREQQINAIRCGPRRKVRLNEAALRKTFACLDQHIWR